MPHDSMILALFLFSMAEFADIAKDSTQMSKMALVK
ncbi:hypothetical protein GLYMA_17G031850v4 [Glycine max]|nr:hypothetical protein GLYMA_17G031850v4 [Glycine max]KAH1116507.1 hypothetical protein GYH30_046096 [Glycine max]